MEGFKRFWKTNTTDPRQRVPLSRSINLGPVSGEASLSLGPRMEATTRDGCISPLRLTGTTNLSSPSAISIMTIPWERCTALPNVDLFLVGLQFIQERERDFLSFSVNLLGNYQLIIHVHLPNGTPLSIHPTRTQTRRLFYVRLNSVTRMYPARSESCHLTIHCTPY